MKSNKSFSYTLFKKKKKHLKSNCKTYGRKHKRNLFNLRLSKALITWSKKEKLDKLDFWNLKISALQETLLREWRDWEKIFAKYIPDKELIANTWRIQKLQY